MTPLRRDRPGPLIGPCLALQRPPRPLAPLRCAQVSWQVQKCAVVVLVQCSGDVCWSVHRGRVRACARARVCACAAQVLPNAPTPAGNGSPVPELPNHRTLPRAQGPPPCRALVHGSFIFGRVYKVHVDEAVMGLSVHADGDGAGDNPLLRVSARFSICSWQARLALAVGCVVYLHSPAHGCACGSRQQLQL